MSNYTDKKVIIEKINKIDDSLPNGDLKALNSKLKDLKFHQDSMRNDVRLIKKATK